MRTPAWSRSRRGVTMVESVVALFVFGMFMSGACDLVAVTRQAMDRAQLRYAAVNLAKSRAERVMGFAFDQVNQCVMNQVVVDAGGAPDSAGAFRLSTSITQVSPVLKQITVHVDIRNRRTTKFDCESQEIISYVNTYMQH